MGKLKECLTIMWQPRNHYDDNKYVDQLGARFLRSVRVGFFLCAKLIFWSDSQIWCSSVVSTVDFIFKEMTNCKCMLLVFKIHTAIITCIYITVF